MNGKTTPLPKGGQCFECADYTLEDYNRVPPFSGFLPGICGEDGVPLWAHYVSRGQGIASFGADEKDGAIMEFQPAPAAYEDVCRKGFRTFIKTESGGFEPFAPDREQSFQAFGTGLNSLELSDLDCESGLLTHVRYSLLPHESIAALMRRVRITNTSAHTQRLWVLDGMARVLPAGVKNSEFREMSNLVKSFFSVTTASCGAALYSARSTADNTERVYSAQKLHFYFSAQNKAPLPLITDPRAVFKNDCGLCVPSEFYAHPDKLLTSPQYPCNIIPCAFAASCFALKPGETAALYAYAGAAADESEVSRHAALFCSGELSEQRFAQAAALTDEICGAVKTETARPEFDACIKQSFLDNVLRGGLPVMMGDKLLHLYSRRHGDLERDYNYFRLTASHFSQGDGNFRDVCQNRRSDVVFFPETGAAGINEFAALFQADGQNPLELRPFLLRLSGKAREYIDSVFGGESDGETKNCLLALLERGADVAEIWRLLNACCTDKAGVDAVTKQLIRLCDALPQSEFSDGYWIDHWTYLPDMLDSYLKMFPEKKEELFFGEKTAFRRCEARVRPFAEKSVMTDVGPRQYGAVEKKDCPEILLETTLFGRLSLLAALKCASLDRRQTGLEMNAGKPGWNDALNGLPALFASSSSETADLLLLLRRLSELCGLRENVCLPKSVYALLCGLFDAAEKHGDCREASIAFWRESLKLRESFCARVYDGTLECAQADVASQSLKRVFDRLCAVVENGIGRTEREGPLPSTYYINIPQLSCAKKAGECFSEDEVCGFETSPLPAFLEAPAKRLRLKNAAEAACSFEAILNSELYDRKLSMFKTCASLEGLTREAGRICALTPGWFERENIFLHAEYKLLLSLLDAGLYKEYFTQLKNVFTAFLPCEVYGRNPAECSSFIASCANPDPGVAGRGYLPRLSGATAETLSMWQRMFLGETMFTCVGGKLRFAPAPALPLWLFKADGTLSFAYLGCRFAYINRGAADIIPSSVIQELYANGEKLAECFLPHEYASALRERKLKSVTAVF